MAKSTGKGPSFGTMVAEMKKDASDSKPHESFSKKTDPKKFILGVYFNGKEILLQKHIHKKKEGEKTNPTEELLFPTAKAGTMHSRNLLAKSMEKKTPGIQFTIGKKLTGGQYKDERGFVHGEVYSVTSSQSITAEMLPLDCVLANLKEVLKTGRFGGIPISPLTKKVLDECQQSIQ